MIKGNDVRLETNGVKMEVILNRSLWKSRVLDTLM